MKIYITTKYAKQLSIALRLNLGYLRYLLFKIEFYTRTCREYEDYSWRLARWRRYRSEVA